MMIFLIYSNEVFVGIYLPRNFNKYEKHLLKIALLRHTSIKNRRIL